MPAPTIEGSLAEPLSHLANMLADCARFQTLVSALDQAGALASIYWGRFDDGASGHARPRACVRHMDEYDIEMMSSSSCETAGQLMLDLEIGIPSDYQPTPGGSEYQNFDAAYKWWVSQAGVIIDEIMTQRKSPDEGILAIESMQLVMLGLALPEQNQGAWFGVAVINIGYRSET